MSMYKKSIALILGVCLLASAALTGCSSAKSSSSNPASGSTAPVTIQVYSWEASLQVQNDCVVRAYELLHPNVKVVFNYPVQNDNVAYTAKMKMLLLSGQAIDAMMESSVANTITNAMNQTYLPLDPFIAKEGVKFGDIYNASAQYKSKNYGLPIDVSPWFVMINKSMLDKASLAVPSPDWTWDDYKTYATKMTSGSGLNKIYGSYFHTFQNYDLMGVYSTKMDNAYYKADGTLNFGDPNLKSWLQFRNDLENVSKVSVPLTDIVSSKLAYRNEYFGQKVAMVPTGAWMLAEIKDATKWPHDFQTVFAPLPKFGADGVAGRTFCDTKMMSIPTVSKNPDAAYNFIRYYTSDGANIRAGGIPALKSAKMDTILSTIVGSSPDKLYDMKSLNAIFNNPKLQYNTPMMTPVYNSQIDSMFVSECQKYLTGGEDINACISNLQSQGSAIVKSAS